MFAFSPLFHEFQNVTLNEKMYPVVIVYRVVVVVVVVVVVIVVYRGKSVLYKNESIPKNNNPLNALKTKSTVNHKHNGRYVGKIDANDA